MSLLVVSRLHNFDFMKYGYEMHLAVDKIKLRDRRGHNSVGSLKGFVQSIYDEKYLYLKVYKEYTRKGGYFTGDPEQLEPLINAEGEYKSILITKAGYAIYEVSRFFHSNDIKDLLNSLFAKSGTKKTIYEDVNQFSLATMRAFYKSAKEIKLLTIKKVGKVAPNPRMPEEEIEEAVQDMGQEVSNVSLNAGHQQNLKRSQIVNDGLARRSDILELKGRDEDRASFKISHNGKIMTSMPKQSERIAIKLYKIMEKVMGFLSK